MKAIRLGLRALLGVYASVVVSACTAHNEQPTADAQWDSFLDAKTDAFGVAEGSDIAPILITAWGSTHGRRRRL